MSAVMDVVRTKNFALWTAITILCVLFAVALIRVGQFRGVIIAQLEKSNQLAEECRVVASSYGTINAQLEAISDSTATNTVRIGAIEANSTLISERLDKVTKELEAINEVIRVGLKVE